MTRACRYTFLIVLLMIVAAIPADARPRSAQPVYPRIAVLTPIAPDLPQCREFSESAGRPPRPCPILRTIAQMEAHYLFKSFGAIGYSGGRMNPYFVRKHSNRPECIAQNSGDREISEECQKHFAELDDCTHFIKTNVKFEEKMWSVGLELYELRSGKLISTSGTYKTRSRTTMIRAVEALAVRLAHTGLGLPMREIMKEKVVRGVKKAVAERMPVPELPVDDGKVNVEFRSSPVQACPRLYQDGVPGEPVPCRVRLLPGKYRARFEADHYWPADMEFEAEDDAIIKAELSPRFGRFNIDVPGKVQVTVDGTVVKKPHVWQDLDEGKTATVAVADPCYLPAEEKVSVVSGEYRTVAPELIPRPAGLKVIACDKKGNEVVIPVKVDNRIVGRTGETLSVPLCSKTLTVSIGPLVCSKTLQLKEGEVTVLTKTSTCETLTGAGCPGKSR